MKTELKYKLIAIDFDDTIADSDFPDIKGLNPHAKRVMEKIKAHGGKIAVWTARGDLQPVRRYLDEKYIPYDHLNESFTENLIKYPKDSRKIYADVYIDDRNLETQEAGGIDWLKIEKMLFTEEYNLADDLEGV